MHYYEVFAAVLLFILQPISSINIKCDFDSIEWAPLGSIYQCNVKNRVAITSQGAAKVTASNGQHESGQSDDDIVGVLITLETVHYFPQGLEKIFKNLRAIWIEYSHLKHIHQSDLRELKNIVFLNLQSNDIEVLEQGLFDFNTKLKYINLHNNKISKIHPNVFDNLSQLITLFLTSNNCINKFASGSTDHIQEFVKEIKKECPNPPASSSSLVTECLEKYSKMQSQLLTLNADVEDTKSKVNQLKADLTNKMDEKIGILELKLEKILKFLNISD